MCGICGQYNYSDHAPVLQSDVERMMATMVHRGPDDEGLHVCGSVGLGFRRLSIIDLAGGHQPMSDDRLTVWTVFNGEIYNFRELRQELQQRGYVFKTSSDTEVIVYGYKEWGDDVLNRLQGMFGLAIWDAEKRRLLLARDPMGIKLVYFRQADGCVHFGSEMRPLLATCAQRPAVDPVALNLFLRFRYAPSPLTLLSGIKKLAPGAKLVAENGAVRVERWWRFKPNPFEPAPSVDEAEEELTALYEMAVKRHLISDVPLGLLLSGGVDSALLLSLMNRFGTSWDTVTVGYGDSYRQDELADAERTARLLGSRHHSVQISRGDFEASLSGIVRRLEEPIASSSIVPMHFVCQEARKHVKVALIGQGPDELLGGYRRHIGVGYGALWRGLPAWARGAAKSVLRRVPRAEGLQRGLFSLDVDGRLQRYQHVFSLIPGDGIDGLFREGLVPRDAGDTILECWSDLAPLMESLDELGGFQFLEVRSSLPDELLMYADKLSMAHSLELRVPYLDRAVVEYVERLPSRYKVHLLDGKWLHKRIARKSLPQEIVARPKRGFAVNVVDDWFRQSVSGRIHDLLQDGSALLYQYLRQDKVLDLVARHQQGVDDNHKILFSLVALEEWLRAAA